MTFDFDICIYYLGKNFVQAKAENSDIARLK